MARPMRPLVRSGGYYPSNKWTPLVYPGGYTTMNGGEPPIPIEWKTVSGSAPLTFSDALSNEIRSLIQYGKCVTSGGDTYCNNGKLVAVHRSGLPSGYTLLDSVGGSGSQWVITDTYLASTDVVECEFRNSTTTGYGAVYGIFRAGDSSALYGNQTYYGYDVSNNKVDTRIPVDTDWHASRHDFANGTLTIDDTTVTYTPFEFENSTKNAVLSRYYNNSYGYGWKGYVRKFKVTRGNEVICDLLPCKNDQDVAGFYDLAAEKFYAPTGGTLLEGNEVDDYELRVVGTPEVLTVGGGNPLSRDGETSGKIINDDGTVSENANYCISAPFTLSAGNYVCTWQVGSGSRPFSVFAVDESGTPQSDGKLFYKQSSAAGINTGEFTVDAETLAVASYRINAAELSIVNTAVQTASVVNLFSAGAVHDEQDIISGTVTRRTEVVVSGGVISISALSSPVTERVTPKDMSTAEGSNTVTVTSAVDPVTLTVEYATAAGD